MVYAWFLMPTCSSFVGFNTVIMQKAHQTAAWKSFVQNWGALWGGGGSTEEGASGDILQSWQYILCVSFSLKKNIYELKIKGKHANIKQKLLHGRGDTFWKRHIARTTICCCSINPQRGILGLCVVT